MSNKRARRRARRRPKRGFATWPLGKKIAAICGGTFLAVTTIGVGLVASKLAKIEQTVLEPEALNISEEIEHETGYLNVALFGVDSRENTVGIGNLSDSIMIASLNKETKEVKVSSVYRDTVLEQKDGSYNKANAAYAFGGPEEAVALLNKNLDLDIQHYVTVNFNVLVDVIDALGGVEIDVQEDEIEYINGYGTEVKLVTGVDTPDITETGLQTLTGVQATSYTRIRYTAGDDFRRAERQREVLEQMVIKAQHANLSQINKIIDQVFPEIATNFTLTEILDYAKDVMKYRLTETTGFPFDKTTDNFSDAGSVVIPTTLESNVIQLHEFLFGPDGYTPSSTVREISQGIINRSAAGYSDYTTGSEGDLGNYTIYNNYDTPQSDSGTDSYGGDPVTGGDTVSGSQNSNGEQQTDTGYDNGNTGSTGDMGTADPGTGTGESSYSDTGYTQ